MSTTRKHLLNEVSKIASNFDIAQHLDIESLQTVLKNMNLRANPGNAMRLLPNQHGNAGKRKGNLTNLQLLVTKQVTVGEETYELTAKDVFTNIFGAEFYTQAFNEKGWLNLSNATASVTNAKVLTGFLEIYCRVLSLQGIGKQTDTMASPFNWPIEFGEEFVAPGADFFATKGEEKWTAKIDGLWLLNIFGSPILLKDLSKVTKGKLTGVFNEFGKVFKDDLKDEEHAAWLASTPLDHKMLFEAIGCLELAKACPELKVLVRAAGYQWLKDEDKVIPPNLVPVAPQWMQPFNFSATAEDVLYIVREIEKLFPTNSTTKNPPVCIGEHLERDGDSLEFDVCFGARALRVNNKLGIWDVARQRMVANVLELPINDGRDHFKVQQEVITLAEEFGIGSEGEDKRWKDPAYKSLFLRAGVGSEALTRVRKTKIRIPVPAEEMVLLNPFTLLIQGIFQGGFHFLAKAMPEPEQMFDKFLQGYLHLTGSFEGSGVNCGDRHNLERGTAYIRGYAEELEGHTRFPVRFERKVITKDGVVVKTFIETSLADKEKTLKTTDQKFVTKHAPRAVRSALEHFSLVPTNKATFIDSRFCCVQMKHVDEAQRIPMLRVIMKHIMKNDAATDADILKYVRKLFPDELRFISEEKIWKFLAEDILFTLSSKANKLVKRTLMADAYVGQLENAGYRGIHRYGQPAPSMTNVLTEALIFTGMPFAPGMALTFGEGQFTLLDRHTQREQPPVKPMLVEVGKPEDSAKLASLELPEYVLTEGLAKRTGEAKQIPYIKFVLKDGDEFPIVGYKDGSWFVEWNSRPELQKGQIIAHIPFVNEETKLVEYYPVAANADAADGANLVSFKWSYAIQAGNTKSLVVDFELRRKEDIIKCRNTVKAMVARYFDDLLHMPANDHLNLVDANGKRAVSTIFYRDCNKWLDLVFSMIDIVAATIEKNKEHPSMEEAYGTMRTLQMLIGENQEAFESNEAFEAALYSTGLAWHPAAALMGYYQKLIDIFEEMFGKAVWVKFDEPFVPADRKWAEGFIACSRKILTGSEKEVDFRNPIKGWTEITTEDAFYSKLPVQAHWQDVLILAQTSDLSILDTPEGDKVDICLFAKTINKLGEEKHILMQRGWGYVGTPDCPVYQPVKAELSSVRASITSSQVMGGVMRYFGRKDKNFAKAMVWEGYPNYAKAGVIYAMSLGQGISHLSANGKAEQLPVVKLFKAGFDKDGKASIKISDEAAAIIQTPELVDIAKNDSHKFLVEVAKRTTKVVFDVTNATENPTSLYMPVIAFQDRNGMGNIGSFSNLAGELLKIAVLGGTLDEQGKLLGKRLRASLTSLAKSKSLAKAASRGRKGTVAKVVALPCIPLCEIWIKESTVYKSEYQNAIRTNGWKRMPGKLQGAPCFFDRAPMPFGALIKVRVITADPSDPYNGFYDLMSDCTRYMNAIAAAYTGGDYDGDTGELVSALYTTIDENGNQVEKMVENIPFLSLEALITCVENRTGRDNLEPGANYYGDYLQILSQTAVANKRGATKKNITLFSSTDPDHSLVLMLERSVDAFTSHVGKIHAFFLVTDLYLSLTWECWNNPAFRAQFPNWNLAEWEKVQNLIEVLAEIYEVPLAGYDKPAYTLFEEFLFPALYEGKSLNQEELIAMEYWMKEAGMNASGNNAQHLHQAAMMFRSVMHFSQKGINLNEEKDQDGNVINPPTPQEFIEVAAAISFLMSKGNFCPVGASVLKGLDVDELLSEDEEETSDNSSSEDKWKNTQNYIAKKLGTIKDLAPFFALGLQACVDMPKAEFKGKDVAVYRQWTKCLLELATKLRLWDVLLNGNEFLGNAHTSLVTFYNKVVAKNELVELINDSVVLLPIEIYKKTMLPALFGTAPEVDCGVFGFSLEDATSETEEAKLPQAQVKKETMIAGINKSKTEHQVRVAIEGWSPATEEACATFNALTPALKKAFAFLPKEVRDLPEWSLFSADQWLAELTIISGEFKRIIVTGRAGSGKTMTSKFADKAIKMMGIEVWKAASTGIAAQNMGGDASTLASKFCLGISELLPESCPNDRLTSGKARGKLSQVVENFIKKSGWNVNKNKPLVIFIDEVSMLSSETLILFLEVLKLACMRFHRDYRIVYFGDFRQLLSVPSDKKEYKMFNNLAFDDAEFLAGGYAESTKQTFASALGLKYVVDEAGQGSFNCQKDTCVISLVTNHRQKNAEGRWIDVLNALGDGNKAAMLTKDGGLNTSSPLGQELAKRVYLISKSKGVYCNLANYQDQLAGEAMDIMPEALHIYHSNLLVAKHNKNVLSRLISKGAASKTYKTIITNNKIHKDSVAASLGESMLGTTMEIVKDKETNKEVVNYRAEQTIVMGQKWMCRQNIDDNLKNGTVGVVTQLDEDAFWIKTSYSSSPVCVSAQTELKVKTDNNGDPIACAKGVPGHPAYALVPHKVQGLTILPDPEVAERGNVVIHINRSYATIAQNNGMHGVLYVACSRTATPEQTIILLDDASYLGWFVNSNDKVKTFVDFSEANTASLLNSEEGINMPNATFKGVKTPITWQVTASSYAWLEEYKMHQVCMNMQPSNKTSFVGRLNMFFFPDADLTLSDGVLWEESGKEVEQIEFNREDPMQAAAIEFLKGWQPPTNDGGNGGQPTPPNDPTPPSAPEEEEEVYITYDEVDAMTVEETIAPQQEEEVVLSWSDISEDESPVVESEVVAVAQGETPVASVFTDMQQIIPSISDKLNITLSELMEKLARINRWNRYETAVIDRWLPIAELDFSDCSSIEESADYIAKAFIAWAFAIEYDDYDKVFVNCHCEEFFEMTGEEVIERFYQEEFENVVLEIDEKTSHFYNPYEEEEVETIEQDVKASKGLSELSSEEDFDITLIVTAVNNVEVVQEQETVSMLPAEELYVEVAPKPAIEQDEADRLLKEEALKALDEHVRPVEPVALVVCGTGHRPGKLYKHNIHADAYSKETLFVLTHIAKEALKGMENVSTVISGMALGWDTALALAAIELNIPFIAAVPFEGQELTWPQKAQKQYKNILAKASKVVICSEGVYTPEKMQVRNEWMVDNSNYLLALWNGEKGGTGNCIKYAGAKGVTVENVWDTWCSIRREVKSLYTSLNSKPATVVEEPTITESLTTVNNVVDAVEEGTEVSEPKSLTQRFTEALPNPTGYTVKDVEKASRSNKFIGAGTPGSSTEKYRQVAGELGNCGSYVKDDVIFISTNGARSNRVNPIVNNNLVGAYKDIDLAIKAGATFVTDTPYHRGRSFNVGEQQIANYLLANGYEEKASSGVWIPKQAEPKVTEVKVASPSSPQPILFNSKTEGYEELSNFWVAPLTEPTTGLVFPSVEALYQASKGEKLDTSLAKPVNTASLTRKQRKELSFELGKVARTAGKKAKLKTNWDSTKVELMMTLVYTKFSGYPELKQMLLSTGDRPLLHLSPWDTFWGVDENGQGDNMLGEILMGIRTYLRNN